jgi:hypothetical protein
VTPTADRGPPPGAASIPEFAEAMSALVGGVVLVTCWLEDRPWGDRHGIRLGFADPSTVSSRSVDGTTAARSRPEIRRQRPWRRADRRRPLAGPGRAQFSSRSPEPGGRPARPHRSRGAAHFDCELVDDVRIADHRLPSAASAHTSLALQQAVVYQRVPTGRLPSPLMQTRRPKGVSNAARVESQNRAG